jgi:hypothetical protein
MGMFHFVLLRCSAFDLETTRRWVDSLIQQGDEVGLALERGSLKK